MLHQWKGLQRQKLLQVTAVTTLDITIEFKELNIEELFNLDPVECPVISDLREKQLKDPYTNTLIALLWARSSEPICRDGPISRWRLQSMY